jgi:hypothetical protein
LLLLYRRGSVSSPSLANQGPERSWATYAFAIGLHMDVVQPIISNLKNLNVVFLDKMILNEKVLNYKLL